MVFSLFGRKAKPTPHKAKDGAAARVMGRAPDSRMELDAQREAARRTAEKIDRIESEMMGTGGQATPVTEAPPASTIAAPTVPVPTVTAPAPAAAPKAGPAPAKPAGADGGKVVRLPPRRSGGGHGTTVLLGDSVNANAIDIFGSSLPALLEEAAILYANGQADQAVTVLRQALEDDTTESVRPLAWMMLLDLYQGTGNKTDFETAALDYAEQFEASAPGWDDEQAAAPAAVSAPGANTTYGLPAQVGEGIAAMCARATRATNRAGDAVIDCTAVRSVDVAGAAHLVALVDELIAARRAVVFIQPVQLASAARAAVETGRRDPSPACWMLGLFALRLLGERQQFEDLAIEYCVTYEVSPPSWEPLPAFVRVDARARRSSAGQRAQESRSGAFVLAGEVLGRMQAELNALQTYAHERGDVVIDCRRLRRIDFVAAGELLNAVVGLRSGGKQVLFVEPNHLVLALMILMGIVDLVEIRSRRV